MLPANAIQMFMGGGGHWESHYMIGHSIRFRGGQSITRTYTTGSAVTVDVKVKRGKLGVISPILGSAIKFNADDTLTAFSLTTTAKFRDIGAHLHINVSNLGLRINGRYLGAVTTSALVNAAWGTDGTNYLDGCLSEPRIIEGTVAYDLFGRICPEKDHWEPIGYSGSYGAQGSFLKFDDGTSGTTLGYDRSGNGNHWTFSFDPVANGDWIEDTPTNNHCVLTPLDPYARALVSYCGMRATPNGSSASRRYGSMMLPKTGVWQWECKNEATPVTISSGIAKQPVSQVNQLVGYGDATSWGYYASAGLKYYNSVGTAWGSAFSSASDILGVVFNADTGELFFYKSGALMGGGPAFTGLTSGPYYAAFSVDNLAGSGQINFGQRPFAYPIAGAKSLCARNEPEPLIAKPSEGFKVTLATEDNIYAQVAAARAGWTDYVDILKNRAASESWAWQFSHDSANEYAIAASSVTRQAKRAQSGSNAWVGYSIKIGAQFGTAAGSVSHTSGAATTVTHNVGKSARQLILLFPRAGGSSVKVYHPDLTAGKLLDLCSTAAETTDSSIASVTSNSFQIGSGMATGTYDYLILSELSGFLKLGKHKANGNADGVYGSLSFMAKFTVFRDITNSENFWTWDSARDSYNPVSNGLTLNASTAEDSTTRLDLVSQGYKCRTAANPNTGTNTFIYAAFAALPGRYANAR